jgi:hypothetical protein
MVTLALLAFASWAFHSYRSSVLDPEFLAYGLSIRPPEITEKGHTVLITIDSPLFVGKIETGDFAMMNRFQVLAGPGTADKTTRSFIVDWTRRSPAPRPELERYRVSFRLVGYVSQYVVLYAYDPSRKQGYVYLPGKADEPDLYRANQSLITRGVEGAWFRALQSWNEVAMPMIQTKMKRKTVVALAQACIAKSPTKYGSMWGSPLNFDKAKFSSGAPVRAYIYIPEDRPRGAPEGLAMFVDVRTGECGRLPME